MTLLPLPPLHPDVLAACQAAGWKPVTYQGASITPASSQRYAGIVATHGDGDIRFHVEWQADPDAGQWRTRFAEVAIRCPGHLPGDFARVYPRQHPGCQGPCCRLSGTHSLLRLLALPPGVIADAVIDCAAAN